MDRSLEGPEALDWLRKNSSESGFASNRFPTTADAIAFAEEIYAAGAKRVFIPLDSIRDHARYIEENGGPYSDSMVIELPEAGREAIFELYEREAESEGYEGMTGSGSVIDGRFLFLWWD